jgi:uncharacterized cupin superfamily protein
VDRIRITPLTEIQELRVSNGDFGGFHYGPMAAKFAHGLRAGEDGLEYLMGGKRREMDMRCYPR